MALNKESDHYALFCKYVTYEQVSELKRAVEMLLELRVDAISRELLHETLNLDEGPLLSEGEEDTLFKIISNEQTSGNTKVFHELVETLERDLFSEMMDGGNITNKDDDFVIAPQQNDSFDNIHHSREDNSISGHVLSAAVTEMNEIEQKMQKIKTNISEYMAKKTDMSVLTENYKMLGTCADQLSKNRIAVEKVKINHDELYKDKQRMLRIIQNLKLDISNLNEYLEKLGRDNAELAKRITFFEEENKQMANINKKIEGFKEEAQQRTEQAQLKLVQKAKECEQLTREKNELEVIIRGLKADAPTPSSKPLDDHLLGKETILDLEQAKSTILQFKDNLVYKRKEIEKLTIQSNRYESEVKTLKIDLENLEKESARMKTELKELKERLGISEKQKRDAINNLGVSKLGLSNLNFSKYFEKDKDEGLLGTGYKAMEPDSTNVSVINLKKEVPKVPKLELNATPKAATKSKTPLVEPTPRFFFDEVSQFDAADNPYLDDNPSLVNRPAQSVMRVRESRVTGVLLAFGKVRRDIDLKQDYMNMSSVNFVRKELERLGDTTLKPQTCYSDSIFVFDKNFEKNRCIIMITPHSISFFNIKKSKLIKFYLLKSLKGITISAENFTLSVFHFEKQADLLLESYRRLEMISYANQMLHQNKLPKFDLTVRKRFVIKSGVNMQVLKNIEVTDPDLKIALPYMQDTIRNSKKSGYLNKLKNNWYGTTSTEHFCILSNIGILTFKKYGDRKPTGFQPILGAKVYKEENKKDKKAAQTIHIRYGDDVGTYVAVSVIDAMEWIESIEDLQGEAISSFDTQKEIQQYSKK